MKIENLPSLESNYNLSKKHIDDFKYNGHVLLREVATGEEISCYQPIIQEAVFNFNQETRALADRDTFGKAFLQTINLWRKDARIKKYVMSKRFGKIAADLLGVDQVRLYLDQSFFKESGGGPTPWHQDNEYMMELDPDKKITMWMPLIDIPSSIGSLSFISGSHKLKSTTMKIALKEKLNTVTYGGMKAGDATFHDGWILHGANQNNEKFDREVMTITYYADPAKIIHPHDNEDRIKHLTTYFPGRSPGDLANTHLNPIVFDRDWE
ncbi:phytanoyl-CoA dioxygenase family protein [Bacillus sp. SM2101]|uniref:phytanoyl-CoA dioxygenase family protein n=1 Tax=Bacillus sp. SM2101 TaxID=2805366 RepID=UPI001BDF51CA|nr:phytanoyl-CoA dioxygenase family protein [Bacillus sp. SM2101]